MPATLALPAIWGAILLLTAATILWLFKALLKLRSEPLPPGAMRVGPSRPSTLIGLAGMVGLSGFLFYAAWTSFPAGDQLALAACGLFSLAFAASVAHLLIGGAEVIWDHTGIEGPSALNFPPFGPKRVRLLWTEIAKGGSDYRHAFLATADGRKIAWIMRNPGHEALVAQIRRACPRLFADDLNSDA